MILPIFIVYAIFLAFASLILAKLFLVGDSAEVPLGLFIILIMVTGFVGFGIARFACEDNKRSQAIKNNVGFYASTNGAFYFKNLNDK